MRRPGHHSLVGSRGQQSLSFRSLFLVYTDSDARTHTEERLRSHACSRFTVLMYGRLRVELSVSFNGLSKPPVQPLTGSATLHKSSVQTQPTPVKQRRERTALICAGSLPTAAARLRKMSKKNKNKKRHNKQSRDFRTSLHNDEQINKKSWLWRGNGGSWRSRGAAGVGWGGSRLCYQPPPGQRHMFHIELLSNSIWSLLGQRQSVWGCGSAAQLRWWTRRWTTKGLQTNAPPKVCSGLNAECILQMGRAQTQAIRSGDAGKDDADRRCLLQQIVRDRSLVRVDRRICTSVNVLGFSVGWRRGWPTNDESHRCERQFTGKPLCHGVNHRSNKQINTCSKRYYWEKYYWGISLRVKTSCFNCWVAHFYWQFPV